MPHPLDGSRAKIERGKEVVHHLNAEIADFLAPDKSPYRIEKRIHPLSGKYSFNAVGPPVPLRFAVLAGEIIHHLRSSLDHLTWALACRNVQRPGRIQFPICESREKFDKAIKQGSIRGVSRRAQELIESIQPYHTTPASNSALFQLHVMDIADKHRMLVITTNLIRPGQHMTIDPGQDDAALTGIHMPEEHRGATESGIEILALSFDKVHPKMNVNMKFTVDIVFEEVGPRLKNPSVVEVMAFFCRRVSHVVNLFEDEFRP